MNSYLRYKESLANELFVERAKSALNMFDEHLNTFTFIDSDGKIVVTRTDEDGTTWKTTLYDIISATAVNSDITWNEV